LVDFLKGVLGVVENKKHTGPDGRVEIKRFYGF